MQGETAAAAAELLYRYGKRRPLPFFFFLSTELVRPERGAFLHVAKVQLLKSRKEKKKKTQFARQSKLYKGSIMQTSIDLVRKKDEPYGSLDWW